MNNTNFNLPLSGISANLFNKQNSFMKVSLKDTKSTDPTSYTFSDVYMFSDEEGGAPFIFDSADEKNVVGSNENIPVDLMREFKFEKPEGVAGGLITGIKKNASLVFLGDLLDNQDCSIRSLRSMCYLKDKYPTQVLLIGGNRDYNKIRLGFELYITCGGTLPWDGVADFAGMVEKLKNGECTFRKMDVPNYIKSAKLGAWNDPSKGNSNPMIAIERNFTSGKILDRVQRVYAATLGAGAGMKLFQKELNDMFPGAGVGDLQDADMAKVLCAVQMLLSFYWQDLPSDLEVLNGLYLHYLRRSHALALFEIDGKYGVVSHGGMPVPFMLEKTLDDPANPGKKITTQERIEKTLTSPFGFMPDVAGFTTPASLKTIIREIEVEKNKLIDYINSLRDSGYDNNATDEAHKIISKFVHLTALSSLPNGANSGSSPIVGMQPVLIENRLNNLKVTLQGGSTAWINANLDKPSEQKKYLSLGNKVISYDIFGHAPQGFLPTAYRKEGTETLHVNLDVSKIDGPTNNYSFAMLHLKKGAEPEFIGRFKMQPAKDKAHTYLGTTAEYIGKVVYYKVSIPSGPVSLLRNAKNASRFTEKMPIKVTLKGFERIYNLRGGYHKGRKHTRKAKKSHKKRGTRKH